MGSKDRKRAEATGMVIRGGRLVSKEQAAAIVKERPIFLKCNKCKTSVPVYMAEDHIMSCQGGKAECSKCHMLIPAKGFVEHFLNCEGKKEEKE